MSLGIPYYCHTLVAWWRHCCEHLFNVRILKQVGRWYNGWIHTCRRR